MKKVYLTLLAFAMISAASCTHDVFVDSIDDVEEIDNLIHGSVLAGTPSNSIQTKVVISGDSVSEPIQVYWRGSNESFREQFSLVLNDNDGNLFRFPATRSADEIMDALSGIFDYDVPEYGYFSALYPYKTPDAIYMSGSDLDKDNWVYRLDGQSGKFSDLHNYDFMTGENPVHVSSEGIGEVQFKHEVAILRLSSLSVPELAGKTITGLTLKSDAIADAASYRLDFSSYYGASTDIMLSGVFDINESGTIDENIYVSFFPSGKSMTYFTLSVDVEGITYSYSYKGAIKSFDKGKVYTLKNAELVKRGDHSASYSWYKNPVSENTYELASVEEFFEFAKLVNGDASALAAAGESSAVNFYEKTIRVSSDVTEFDLSSVLMPGESWPAIKNFMGTFLGNGVHVTNLYNDAMVNEPYGLFGVVTLGVIDGVDVSGSIDCNLKWNENLGGLVGRATTASVIRNCSSDVTITIGSSYGRSIGGLCGSVSDGSYILGCSSYSDITVSTASSDRDYVGGLVGWLYSGSIVGSYFEGYVSGRERSYVGGISGYMMTGCTINGSYAYCSLSSGSAYPGYISSSNYTSNPGNVSACYFNSNSSETGKYNKAVYGIGCYNGYAYNHNTEKATDLSAAVTTMNGSIDMWNVQRPNYLVNNKFKVVSDKIILR